MNTKVEINIKELPFFFNNLWKELIRYNYSGQQIGTVTCTEENLFNLFNSQSQKALYGEIYRYELYNQ